MNDNIELGKLKPWKDFKCARCGSSPAERTLNIEAMIHHNAKQLLCINQKECRKRQAKKKVKD